MSLHEAVVFFIAMFIFGVTPGPGIFSILARALIHGPRQCVSLAFGMILSDQIYLTLACIGLVTIANNWSEVFLVIRYLGAAYLIFLGYKIIKSAPLVKNDVQSKSNSKKYSTLSSIMQGFLISASNPKVIVFYISFLPTFIDLNALKIEDMVTASLLSFAGLFAGLMLIAIAASRMSKIIKTPMAHKKLNRSAGGIMIAAGSYLAIKPYI